MATTRTGPSRKSVRSMNHPAQPSAAPGSMAPVPILMYHNIAPAPRDIRVYRSLYVSPRAFARQMWLLRRLGYVGLSMTAAEPYFRGEREGWGAGRDLGVGLA